MYGIYRCRNIREVNQNCTHEIHNITSSHEKLFAGEHNPSVFRILYTHSLGLQQYSTNSPLYLRIIQDKYISLYRELITQLHTYVLAIRILAKGYLSNTLIKPDKLSEKFFQKSRNHYKLPTKTTIWYWTGYIYIMICSL